MYTKNFYSCDIKQYNQITFNPLFIMKLRTGDNLYEPLSRNTGEITSIIEHPEGKVVKVRWRLDGQLPHDTELFYKKVQRCIRDGLYEHTPKQDST